MDEQKQKTDENEIEEQAPESERAPARPAFRWGGSWDTGAWG